MDRAEAMLLLPEQYATALRLSEAGASQRLIAAALDIEPAAVGPLLQIAEAKLENVLTDAARRDTRGRTSWER